MRPIAKMSCPEFLWCDPFSLQMVIDTLQRKIEVIKMQRSTLDLLKFLLMVLTRITLEMISLQWS